MQTGREERYEVMCAGDTPDRGVIAQLWASAGMSDEAIALNIERRMDWLYGGSNPFGSAKTWLVRDNASGRVVGSASVIPRNIIVDGIERSAAMMADFVVHPEHRLAGPALLLQRTVTARSAEQGLEFTFGYPNTKAWPVFARIGYKAVGKSTTWARPLRSRLKLTRLVTSKLDRYSKSAGRLNWLSGAIRWSGALIVDGALGLYDTQAQLRSAPRYRYRVIDRADERFEALSRVGSTRATPVRSAAHLNWRYADHPTMKYEFHCLFERASGSLRAYAVSSVARNALCLQDLVSAAGSSAVAPLLHRMARRAHRSGLESIVTTYLGEATLPSTFKRCIFVGREDERSFIVQSRSLDKDIAAVLQSSDSWALLDGELDI